MLWFFKKLHPLKLTQETDVGCWITLENLQLNCEEVWYLAQLHGYKDKRITRQILKLYGYSSVKKLEF